MGNQQIRSALRRRLTISLSLLALYLFVSIVAGLMAPRGDLLTASRNILASVAILSGLLGLLVYLARQAGWRLPPSLQLPEERRDENWRLLAMSLTAIGFPIIMIATQLLLLLHGR